MKESLDKVADRYVKFWTKGSEEQKQEVLDQLTGSVENPEVDYSEVAAVTALMSLRMKSWKDKADLAQGLWEITKSL